MKELNGNGLIYLMEPLLNISMVMYGKSNDLQVMGACYLAEMFKKAKHPWSDNEFIRQIVNSEG